MDTELILRVPVINIAAMAVTLLLAVGIPVALFIIIRKKYHAQIRSFFIGCAIFIVFALILEQVLHAVVLYGLGSVSVAVRENTWLYALYGGMAAALFEEAGRFIGMTFFMKKSLDKENALMYGAGHGGIEAILLIGFTYINNIVYSLNANSGMLDEMLQGENGAELYAALSPLADLPAGMFFAAGLERVLAIALQIALSVMVYMAVKHGKNKWVFIAMLFHFGVNFLAVAVNELANVWISELVVLAGVSLAAAVAYKLYATA